MEVEPNTSLEVNNTEIPTSKRWTRNLNGLPAFNYELLTKHLGTEQSGSAHKHKKLGYQMFKDKYICQVEVKVNVIKDNILCFLIKAWCKCRHEKHNIHSICSFKQS
jgi:hypothetical protein